MAKRKIGLDWLLQDRISGINRIVGCDNEKLIDFYNAYITNHPNTSEKNILWAYYQFLITETPKNSKDEYEMYRKQSAIYFAMARFRMDYEKIKDSRLFQLAHESNTKSYKNDTSFKMQMAIISGHCCDYCDSLDGKKFSMDYALKNKILDMEKCTRENGCNCTTCSIPERDENGDLIYIEEQPKLLNEKKGCLFSLFY